jgi:hypothetical protein
MASSRRKPDGLGSGAVALAVLFVSVTASCSNEERSSTSKEMAPRASSDPRTDRAGVGAQETPLLGEMPVGAWAEYETRATGLRLQQVIALVHRTSDGDSVLETQLRDSADTRAVRVITRETFSRTSRVGDAPKARVVQVDGNQPMEYPDEQRPPSAGPGLGAFGPQTYAATENVSVPAGTFLARKYVSGAAEAGQSVLWIDHGVQPLGIVKLMSASPSGNPAEAAVMQLVRTGDGAAPTIVGPPRPFDAELYQHQMIAGRAELPPSGPPPSSPVP